MMKRLLLVWVMVFGLGMPGWGQGMVDYAEFAVLGKRGDVTMVVKDNDYRMVVGKMKKPGSMFLMVQPQQVLNGLNLNRLAQDCKAIRATATIWC